jgi:hypothetical protein
LELVPNIISSLHNNGGQFIQFTSITDSLSPQAKKFLESNSESPQEYDQQNNTQGPKHVALSGSARFGDRVGVRAANDSEDLIRKLYTFCAIKGNYESMMIMLESPPAHTSPIDPITIRQFVHHHMASPRTPLFVDFTIETVLLLDIFNNPIHAQGACQSLDGMKHTYGPITILHEKHSHAGPHHNFCPECRPHLIEHAQLKSIGPIPKCTFHQNFGSGSAFSLYFSSGDPVNSKDVKLAKANMRNSPRNLDTKQNKEMPFFHRRC